MYYISVTNQEFLMVSSFMCKGMVQVSGVLCCKRYLPQQIFFRESYSICWQN